jgi:signal peptidase I
MNQSEQQIPENGKNKEPWFAVNLSGILPGIGQIYAGKTAKGYTILASFYILISIGGWLLIDTIGNPLMGIVIILFAGVFLPIWNLFDSYHTAKSVNSREFESDRKQNKDAWLAVFLSGFIPGLGHAYLKKWIPCILFFATFVIVSGGSALELKYPGIALASAVLKFLLGVLALYFAYISAPVHRDSRKAIVLFITAFVGISVVFNAILAFTIRQFVAEARYIPAASMEPTLKINDRLIINKLTYRFHAPERGDIVVFSPPEALRKEGYKDAFIKRIIGIPGDRIEVKSGKVYINGKVLNENYLDEASHYNWSSTALTPDGVVPGGHYLVLGDNRNNSYDSHYWGFVPRENIIGKATQRFFPFDRIGSIAAK